MAINVVAKEVFNHDVPVTSDFAMLDDDDAQLPF